MPSFLGGMSLTANTPILPMSVVSLDTTGDHLCRQATGGSDGGIIGIAQVAVDLPPNSDQIFAPGSSYTPVAAASGIELTVYGPGDIAPVIVGPGGITAGYLMTSNGAGLAIGAIAGNTIVGKALQSGSANDQIDIVVILGKI